MEESWSPPFPLHFPSLHASKSRFHSPRSVSEHGDVTGIVSVTSTSLTLALGKSHSRGQLCGFSGMLIVSPAVLSSWFSLKSPARGSKPQSVGRPLSQPHVYVGKPRPVYLQTWAGGCRSEASARVLERGFERATTVSCID